MATQEKLLKSLESLRNLANPNLTTDTNRKKEKIQHCNIITETMTNATIKIAPNFGYLLSSCIETLLSLCNDPESDIRMIADECLNRLVKAMNDGNISKIQIELHKEIKKNGPPRSLRAALWRFSELARHIRPHKGKPYVANLIPCMVKITERSEEMVHETLANSLPKIIEALGCFTTDNDIKILTKAFLRNISNSSAVIRRTTINCILTTCLNCRKPYIFMTYILNNLLDMLVPIQDEHCSHLILGVMGCLKTILPHIRSSNDRKKIGDSFRTGREVGEDPLKTDQFVQIYELCLHYILINDHNVVNASLETLNALLQNSSDDFKSLLLSPDGLGRSRLLFSDSGGAKSRQRSPSQLSMAMAALLSSEESLTELTDSSKPDIERWIDESKLSMLNVTYATTLEKSPGSEEELLRSSDVSVDSRTIGGGGGEYDSGGASNKTVVDSLDRLALSETSSERSFVQVLDREGSTSATDENIACWEVDIGQLQEKQMALLYCARLIVKSFLLSGRPDKLIPDGFVRVSIKSLSLNCLATIFRMYPPAFVQYLEKTGGRDGQQISDVLLYKDHIDPQLRGTIRALVGNFIRSVLAESGGDYGAWIARNVAVDGRDVFQFRNLIDVIAEGLGDVSSNCSRQSLQCLNVCLRGILESRDGSLAVPLLNALPLAAKNPYWLVRATLVEVVSNIDYITVQYTTGTYTFQDKVLRNVFFELLEDENEKVRSACSSAIARVLPLLHFERTVSNEDLITCKARRYKNSQMTDSTFELEFDSNLDRKRIVDGMPFPFDRIHENPDVSIREALSRIVSELAHSLLASKSKCYIRGCVETLSLLSDTYPPTVHSEAWSCFKSFPVTDGRGSNAATHDDGEPIVSSSMGLFGACMNLLCNDSIAYDMHCHLHLLKLAGNLFSGISIRNLKSKRDPTLGDAGQPWDMFTDKILSNLAEQFFAHILKLLNIFQHAIEETTPVQPQHKTVLPNLPAAAALSPIKRRKSDLGERSRAALPAKASDREERTERGENNARSSPLAGHFATSPHYLKVYECLKAGHANYKMTLDSVASEKFVRLLRETLRALSQLLELATLLECGRISEEILTYFQCTFNLDPSSTVTCVQQLLKSLFGTNLTASEVSDVTGDVRDASSRLRGNRGERRSFYGSTFQEGYDRASASVASFNDSAKVDRDGDNVVMGYLRHKENKKAPPMSRGADKILASYIRSFESMVIKSLKQYTVTNDVKLQCKVLQLLCQLVRLRVNYCLLDSEQIFIGFVLKQFEYIEEGQILLAGEMVPRIFEFLVHLSHGKQHSKSIIGVPKVIQLCDGLMASGQPPLTHCVPALRPVVEDIFLCRNRSNAADFRELETTREVLLAMLLRLLEYRVVMGLLSFVLNESKHYGDNSDKWSKWSRQVADVLLPSLERDKVLVSDPADSCALRGLVSALNPAVFKPLNDVLLILFDDPPPAASSTATVNCWLGKIHTLLMVAFRVKEEALLLKIAEVQLDFKPGSVFRNVSTVADPLNVTNTAEYFDGVAPEVVLVRYIFRAIHIVTENCSRTMAAGENAFLAERLSGFLMFCSCTFRSGSHGKIAAAAIELASGEIPPGEGEERLPIKDINRSMLELAPVFPLLTFEWCCFLAWLKHNDRQFWSRVLQVTESYGVVNRPGDISRTTAGNRSINMEIVRLGGTLAFCNYLNENMGDGEELSWFLINNVGVLVRLCDEEPVFKFVSSLHRKSSASGLLIQAVATKCLPIMNPTLETKILRTVEEVHPSRIGPLLHMLVSRLLDCGRVAFSRTVANLASRKVELLLTMSAEEVHRQLSKDDLMAIMDSLVENKLVKKHEALVSLLNKLATQHYDLSPLEFDQRRTLNPKFVRELTIDRAWYVSQVRSKSRSKDIAATAPSAALAELLGCLDYGDALGVMADRDFNRSILKDCIAWGANKMAEGGPTEEPCLLRASVDTLKKDVARLQNLLPKQHQVYRVLGRRETAGESLYSLRLTELFSDNSFWSYLHDVIRSVRCYMGRSASFPTLAVSPNDVEGFAKCAVTCLESISYLVGNRLNISCAHVAMTCAERILCDTRLHAFLAQDACASWSCSAINGVYRAVAYFSADDEPLPSVPKHNLEDALGNPDTLAAGHACHQLSVLVSWLERGQTWTLNIPKCLSRSIRSIIVSLSRLPLVNSYLLIPPSACRNGLSLELTGTFGTRAPPLPMEYLQDIDVLEEFVFRITLLGWTSRQQFEEMWMCTLGVLSANPTQESSLEEVNAIVHVTGLAVRGITALLLQTSWSPVPGNTHVSGPLHVSRHLKIKEDDFGIAKLKVILDKLQRRLEETTGIDDSGPPSGALAPPSNLEKLDGSRYSLGQLSVEYLLISTGGTEPVDEARPAGQVYLSCREALEEYGLDLNSCLQFLMDLYSQWMKAAQTAPLRILNEMVKSILTISDLFVEKSQFAWMLEAFLHLSKTHAPEDEVLHRYLVAGACKAAAVLTPDTETYESVKRLMVQGLRSEHLPLRVASLHGISYLLQGGFLGNTRIGGLSEEMQSILPVAVEYVQCHIGSGSGNDEDDGILRRSTEHSLLVWAVAFYLIENSDEASLGPDFISGTIQVALTYVSRQKGSRVRDAVLNGLQRLVMKRSLQSTMVQRLAKFSLEEMKSPHPTVAIPAVRMLLACIYTDSSEQLENRRRSGDVAQSNPDTLVQTIEKISAVFDRIRRGLPAEVEVLCSVLPEVLNDFFPPADILNKVLGEFLSPQQPHPRLLSRVVFEVFERAIEQSQLPLLQDWVVFSLSNFTQSFSMGTATWCLTCFFMSASRNRWLRALFPHVQCRVGRYEYEDRKMLCVAGADFYDNLVDGKQREVFVGAFAKARDQPDMPFRDLLASLR